MRVKGRSGEIRRDRTWRAEEVRSSEGEGRQLESSFAIDVGRIVSEMG